jgi:predicted RNA binding protein YcfA (HicA-like mRNA interferase family)
MSQPERTTYSELMSLLEQLGFRNESVTGSHCAFRHETSGTLILLADVKMDEAIRTEDMVSIRRHLVDHGLMDARAFDRHFPQHVGAEPQP